MSSPRFPQLAPTLFITALAATGCAAASKRIEDRPITIMRNGDLVADPTRVVDAATIQARQDGANERERRDSIANIAFAGCDSTVCAALGRGEIALGMTADQVLAATRTTYRAWTMRRSDDVVVLTPRDVATGPRDAVASVALVQLVDDSVATISYRESHGLRTVSGPADLTQANRVRAVALSRDGDELAAAGDFTGALDRYDRASVIDRADAELQYKIATSLDKLLRPQEAALRYRLFLHQLELQKIEAVGNANAKLADAIVQARQRLIILEKH
jgi:hypothetical protein